MRHLASGRLCQSHLDTTQAIKRRSYLFGVDGKPTGTKQGYAKVVWQYDDRDNLVSEGYFGLDGKPTLHKARHAKL